MPVYVYKNLTTGATFEVEQRITADALTVDPTSGDPVKRLIQPVGIAFKGSGFYVTDSRKSSRAAQKGDAAKGDAASSDASKTDASASDGSKSDGSKSAGSTSDGSKSDAPKSDAAKSEASTATKNAVKPSSGSATAAGG